jgi:N-acetylglutamate synthase-like GNAT family acetyltransferase
MAQLMAPSIDLPGVYHFLAVLDEEPIPYGMRSAIGICSLVCYRHVGIVGSAGVIPAWRGSRASRNLMIHVIRQAQAAGVETLVLQTVAGAPLERFLRLQGFKPTFTRVGFTFHDERPD